MQALAGARLRRSCGPAAEWKLHRRRRATGAKGKGWARRRIAGAIEGWRTAVPGQGASRGMHCRPPEAEQTHTHLSVTSAGESWCADRQQGGGTTCFNATPRLQTRAARGSRPRRSNPRNRVGEGATAKPRRSIILLACSLFVLREQQDVVKTKLEQRWNLTSSNFKSRSLDEGRVDVPISSKSL